MSASRRPNHQPHEIVGLTGKVAVVTGASRGLGAGIAVTLAAHGAAVAVNYRENRTAAEQVVREISSAGGQAVAVKADVADTDEARALIDAAVDEFGRIDILVNNAWPGWDGGDLSDVSWDLFQRYLDTVLKGAVGTIQAALPTMRRQQSGSIVNIGTTSMYEMNECHAAYIAAKGGLLALTRGLARDLGRDNIRVNIVSPGLIWTDRLHAQPPTFGSSERARTPLNRNAEVPDVADVVLFFASDLARFVTGTHLPVCGGLVMQVG